MTGRTPRLLTAALAAAEQGWPVFPVAPFGKRPAITGWPRRATCDPDQLAAWWQHAPYNIGIACGPAELLVVDLDQPHTTVAAAGQMAGHQPPAAPAECATHGVRNGQDVLAALARRAGHPDPSDTYTVTTPRGQQRYFTVDATDRARARSTVGALGWLIDTRAAGGYVVAAGSVRRVGGRRRYYRRTSAAGVPPAPAPAWLLDALAPPSTRTASRCEAVRCPSAYADAALQAEIHLVRRAAPGTRNTTVFHAARRLGQLVSMGLLAEQHLTAALTDATTGHVGVDGFTAREATTAIDNGLRHGRQHPRTLPPRGDSAASGRSSR